MDRQGDRQGDMGNLETKTKAELMDLLARQEKLLATKKRLSMLPDKGQKVQLLADRLRVLIAKHEAMVTDAADLLEKMEIGAPQGVTESPQNAFLKTEKAPFQPFKTLHTDRIPEGLGRPPPTPPSSGSTPMRGVQEDRPPEMSAVAIPPLKHPGTKYMDVKEAAELLEKQRSKVQALQAAQAAERLSERLHIQMGTYKPDSPGRYRDRDRSNDNSEDEDTDDDEVDDDDDDDDESDDSREIPQQKQHVPNG